MSINIWTDFLPILSLPHSLPMDWGRWMDSWSHLISSAAPLITWLLKENRAAGMFFFCFSVGTEAWWHSEILGGKNRHPNLCRQTTFLLDVHIRAAVTSRILREAGGGGAEWLLSLMSNPVTHIATSTPFSEGAPGKCRGADGGGDVQGMKTMLFWKFFPEQSTVAKSCLGVGCKNQTSKAKAHAH